MHLLATSSASLDDLIEPVDLAQPRCAMAALSFTDSDLAAMRAAWSPELPSLGLAPLRELRHPMSVDLWIDKVAAHARVVLVRVLGGYDWWRYGCDRLGEVARRRGIALVILPGECREDDEAAARLSTISPDERAILLDCFRQGGPDNMRVLLARMARLAGQDIEPALPVPLAKSGFYDPAAGTVPVEHFLPGDGRPVVPILFYRSMLLAGDAAPIDVLVKVGDGGQKTIAARRKHTLKSVSAGVATIETEFQAITPITPEIDGQMAHRMVKGEIRFDIDNGRVLSQRLDVDRTVIGFAGDSSSMHLLTRMEEKLQEGPTSVASKP